MACWHLVEVTCFGSKSTRGFSATRESTARSEVGEHTRIQDNGRACDYPLPGTKTRSYRPALSTACSIPRRESSLRRLRSRSSKKYRMASAGNVTPMFTSCSIRSAECPNSAGEHLKPPILQVTRRLPRAGATDWTAKARTATFVWLPLPSSIHPIRSLRVFNYPTSDG